MDKIHLAIEIIGGIVTVCSALANFIHPATGIGKIISAIALNGPKVQSAAIAIQKAFEPPPKAP